MSKITILSLSLSCFFLIFGCQTKKYDPVDLETAETIDMPVVKRPDRILNAAVLIMEGVFNTELTAPIDIFQHSIYHTEYGIKIFTIAETGEMVKTFEGLKIQPDYAFSDDSIPPIDILIVPSAAHHLDSDLENKVMINWVYETGSRAIYVMSLCDGAFVLAKAGLLDQVQCTTFPGDINNFRNKFPDLDIKEGISFVHDGKIITSAGGAKSFDAALYLAERLYGKKSADGIAGGLVIDWDLKKIECIIVN